MAEDVDEEIESLASVTHGAFVGFTGIFARRLLAFALNFALTQGLAVGAYGVYAFGYRIVGMLSRFTKLGANQALLRFVPKYDDRGRRNRTVGLAYLTAGVASTAVGAAVFVLAPQINAWTLGEPVFVETMRAFALFVPAYTLVHIVANVFRSLELAEYQTGLQQVAEPAARLLGVVLALALGLSVAGVAAAVALAVAALFLIGFVVSLWRTDLRPAATHSWSEVREFYTYTLPVAAATLGALLRSRVDVIIVGTLLSSSAAGIYNIALLLTSFINFPLSAFNQLLPPVASRLYSEGEHDALQAVYSTVTRWVFTLAVGIATVELVYGGQLLRLFGAAFDRGRGVLYVFVFATLTASMVGATGWLLMMTDHERVEAVNSWVLGAANIALSYVLILEVGLVGAALGTGGALAVVNLVRVAQLWYLEDLLPFTRAFLKPVAAAVPMAATMWAAGRALSGGRLLAVGTLAGVLVYVLTLRALGVEDRDRQMYHELAGRYGGAAGE
jgi:O-antigen/teichoic acid export membrane protein